MTFLYYFILYFIKGLSGFVHALEVNEVQKIKKGHKGSEINITQIKTVINACIHINNTYKCNV